MATIVTGEQYKKLDGKLDEIKRQIRQKNGYPFDPSALEYALQLIIEGRFGDLGVSVWSVLFDHLTVWDSNFSGEHFPLEPEGQIKEVIEKRFDDTAIGYDRLRWAESQGLELAGSRATGLYLKANPKLQMERPVIGGGRWQDRSGSEYVPVFLRDDGEPGVDLDWLDDVFSPDCVWLFSRKSSGT